MAESSSGYQCPKHRMTNVLTTPHPVSFYFKWSWLCSIRGKKGSKRVIVLCYHFAFSVHWLGHPSMFVVLFSNIRELKTSVPSLVCLGSWRQFDLTSRRLQTNCTEILENTDFSSEPLRTIWSPQFPSVLLSAANARDGKFKQNPQTNQSCPAAYRVWNHFVLCLLNSAKISSLKGCKMNPSVQTAWTLINQTWKCNFSSKVPNKTNCRSDCTLRGLNINCKQNIFK